MNTACECESALLVQADFDTELDAAQAAALVRHRAECRHCQAVHEQLTRSRALLRAAPRHAVSPELREAIRKRLQEQDAHSASAVSPSEHRFARVRPGGWHTGLGWSAAAAAVLASIVLLIPRSPDLSAQLVSNHLRAVQLDSHLIDVASTDHHTVKPWFTGKVNFAPPRQAARRGWLCVERWARRRGQRAPVRRSRLSGRAARHRRVRVAGT